MKEVFGIVDKEEKGWIGAYDLKRLLANDPRATAQLEHDVLLLVKLFDRSNAKVISLRDFEEELAPVF
jgi:hypothetical protein